MGTSAHALTLAHTWQVQVAIASTGDELAEADVPVGSLAPGAVRDSNRSMLQAAAQVLLAAACLCIVLRASMPACQASQAGRAYTRTRARRVGAM
jgi:hypothetical protein